jgi:hypothetical protein
MAIVKCKEMVQETLDLQATDKGGTHEFERMFLCVSDAPGTDRPGTAVNEVISTFSVPVGTAYPYDAAAFVKAYKCNRQDEDGGNFVVTVKYGQFPYGSNSDSPFSQPAKWKVTGRTMQEVIDWDVTGKCVCNSAGDKFVPGVVRDLDRAVITVTQAESSFSPTEESVVNCVNSNTFLGFSPHTLKCLPIEVDAQWNPNYGWVYQKTYVLEYNAGPAGLSGAPHSPLGWTMAVLDAGLYELVDLSDLGGSGNAKIPITNKCGQAVQQPMLLDGSGHAQDNTSGSTPTPHWLFFEPYQAVNFSFSFRGITS